jgi:hypothetical protein
LSKKSFKPPRELVRRCNKTRIDGRTKTTKGPRTSNDRWKQVQKYQWECIEELARLEKYNDPIEWLRDYILLNILIPRLETVSENYDSCPVAVLKKLSKDGYGR